MQRKRDAIIAAGIAFARSSHPADELFTVNFNEQVWSGFPRRSRLHSDVEQLRERRCSDRRRAVERPCSMRSSSA